MIYRILFFLVLFSALIYGSSKSDFDHGHEYYKQGEYGQAFQIWSSLAKQGYSSAQYNLGVMYEEGQGVQKNYAAAVQWYGIAADMGHSSAQYKLAKIYKTGQYGIAINKVEAAKLYEKAAEQGNEGAQYFLAEMYYDGDGIPQDYHQAFKWFSKLLDKEHPEAAQFYIGSLYYFGHGVPQDYREAVKMYTNASDNGLSSAMNNLGIMYENGEGVSQNNIIAYALYNLSSAKDSSSENDALKYRNSILSKMTNQEIEIGQSLTHNMQTNGISKAIKQYLKTQPKTLSKKSIVEVQSKASSLYPERPAKVFGKTSCNTRCNNGDCYRTYDNGKQKHFQVSPTYNPLNSQFEFNPGPC